MYGSEPIKTPTCRVIGVSATGWMIESVEDQRRVGGERLCEAAGDADTFFDDQRRRMWRHANTQSPVDSVYGMTVGAGPINAAKG